MQVDDTKLSDKIQHFRDSLNMTIIANKDVIRRLGRTHPNAASAVRMEAYRGSNCNRQILEFTFHNKFQQSCRMEHAEVECSNSTAEAMTSLQLATSLEAPRAGGARAALVEYRDQINNHLTNIINAHQKCSQAIDTHILNNECQSTITSTFTPNAATVFGQTCFNEDLRILQDFVSGNVSRLAGDLGVLHQEQISGRVKEVEVFNLIVEAEEAIRALDLSAQGLQPSIEKAPASITTQPTIQGED